MKNSVKWYSKINFRNLILKSHEEYLKGLLIINLNTQHVNGVTLTSDSAVYVWSLLQSTYIFGVLWASLFCSTEKQGRMENYQFSKLQHQHFEVCLCIENAMRSNKVDLCGSLLWGNVKALWLSLQDELSLQGLKRKLLGRADRHYYQELHAEVWFIKKSMCAIQG